MTDKVKEMLDDFNVTIELPVKRINELLNILNMPTQVPAMLLASYISQIQEQAGPQVQKAQASLEAALKIGEKDEPEAAA
jgi:hypothetical protein